MRRILVTGANGFIGRPLCKELATQHYDVVGLARTVKLYDHPIEFIEADLEKTDDFGPALNQVDCIVHLAGRAHVLAEYNTDPLKAFRKINCEATIRLARQAASSGVRRFIFISSIGVNGAETTIKPFDENAEPNPHADYAISKCEAEVGLKRVLAGSDTELVIIRPPLVYDVDAPGNFGRLLKLVSTGLPLPLGRINNRRSILSLDNLISLIVRCIEHPAAAGEIFLASDDGDISTTDMVRALAQGMDKKPLLVKVPGFLVRIFSRALGKSSLYTQLYRSLQVDSSKARDLLGWRPTRNTLEALETVGRLYSIRR